jgi:hypothetical protein
VKVGFLVFCEVDHGNRGIAVNLLADQEPGGRELVQYFRNYLDFLF